MFLSLWLPILVTGIAIFFASYVMWMVLPHHHKDWRKLPDEDAFADAIAPLKIPPAQYIFPGAHGTAEMKSETYLRRFESGPWGTVSIWPNAPVMGSNLIKTFFFYLLAAVFVAYLASMALDPGAAFSEVFRFTATAGIACFCLGGIPNAVWFNRPLVNDILDGVVYGLITGAVFGFLWPGA